MFTNISWVTYITVVAVSLLFWYTFIGIKYYYSDVRSFFSGKHKFLNSNLEDLIEIPGTSDTIEHLTSKGVFEEKPFNDFEAVEELVERVKATISNALENKTAKEIYFNELKSILKNYPSLQQSQYRPSINEFIVSQGDHQGLFSITQEEVDVLWNDSQ